MLNKEELLGWVSNAKKNKSKDEKTICLIIPHLYLGNFGGIVNYHNLISYGIKSVLNCGVNHEYDLLLSENFNYKKIKLVDSKDENLSKVLRDALEFIDKNIDNKIFIHCKGGYSRSPSIVIAYLIVYKEFTFDEAFNLVKLRRPSIHPNEGFISQLKKL